MTQVGELAKLGYWLLKNPLKWNQNSVGDASNQRDACCQNTGYRNYYKLKTGYIYK